MQILSTDLSDISTIASAWPFRWLQIRKIEISGSRLSKISFAGDDHTLPDQSFQYYLASDGNKVFQDDSVAPNKVHTAIQLQSLPSSLIVLHLSIYIAPLTALYQSETLPVLESRDNKAVGRWTQVEAMNESWEKAGPVERGQSK